jgi:hypothetical protein
MDRDELVAALLRDGSPKAMWMVWVLLRWSAATMELQAECAG